MKSNIIFGFFNITSFFVLAVLITSCKKEEIPGNRDFDPAVSVAQIVNINTTEIGGESLKLKSFRDDDSPLYNGEFNTVVSKEGEQLLTIFDENNKLRALTLSTPNSASSNVMQIDAHATSVTVVFISPGILSTNSNEAKNVINNIEKLTSFSPLELYLKNNLKSKSLNDLISTPSYDSLLNHCVVEYYQKYILSDNVSTKGLQVSKNLITLNQISQKKVELKNEGYRFVSVVERDIKNDHSLLNQKIHLPEMKGAIPWGWGSLFTKTMLDPTVDTIDYLPLENSSTSEFWIFGLGRKTKEEVPDSILALEIPWAETIGYYGAFPILDLVSGGSTLLEVGGPAFKDAMRNAKLIVAIHKTSTVETLPQFTIALIDDTFAIIGALASMSSSPFAVAATYAITTVTSAFSAFNFGAFAGSLFSLENYTKFSVLAYNQPPMFPVLSDPANNSINIEIPASFHWTIPTLAETYDFQISKSPSFNSNAFEVNRKTANGIQVNTLEKGTKYYWHVRACNNYGCSLWTETWNFTTIAENKPPTIPSAPNPADGATGEGTAVTLSWSCSDPDVGDQITYDVFFGTTENLTTQIASKLTSPSISRSGLSQGVTYFWGVVAVDNHGEMTLGPTWRFTVGTAPVTTVSDFDGNIYNTITIGTQVWMKENLKTTHYFDGSNLIDGTGRGDISGDFNTKYYFSQMDNPNNADIYGYLYTWAAAMNGMPSSNTNPSNIQGVCPTGWHLPSEMEWQQLIDYLGGIQVAGGKIKETGTVHWLSPNTGATNESDFTALPGSYRSATSYYPALGGVTHFWSSTENSSDRSFSTGLSYSSSEEIGGYTLKDTGISIRCVKNP